MASTRQLRFGVLFLALLGVFPRAAAAQSFNGNIIGTVTDSSGAVIPGVTLTLRNVKTDQVVQTTVSGSDGEYAFRNLQPSKYEVQAAIEGFKPFFNSNIDVTLSSTQRVDIALEVGGQSERVEVMAGSSVLASTATQEHGISPETLQQLPLAFNTGPRAVAGFAVLMPGVSTGGGANAFDARINGGMQSGDEATVDGVSMQQGHMSQGGMVSIFQDFPMSADMVSEVKVLSSNYAPEYGGTSGGQIQAVTKSGGSDFHGSAFDYHLNDALNAAPWGKKKPESRKNNFGVNIGGPAKIPGLWNERVRSYFYFDYEGFRQVGGANRDLLSIPSILERNGDFRDWRDASGNLIPIYDPLTLQNGQKQQFMGCDGRTPNVICADRISPAVKAWLDALPAPTSVGSKNNFLAPPIPDTILGNSDYYMWRNDLQIGNKDHMFASFWHQRAPKKFYSKLPQEIASETLSDPQNSWVNRFNYDRIFTPSLLNHMSMGYLNRNEGYGCVNASFVDDFPGISGVASHNLAPQYHFSDNFAQLGCNQGIQPGTITTRPTFIVNDLVTWTAGTHTLKVGMEYRKIMGNIHNNGNEAGNYGFGRGATGLNGVNSGSPIASFLLGAVDNGNVDFRSVATAYPRQNAWAFHAGDTWRIGSKLTFDYGLRWDYFSPSSEKYDRMSFFDPLGANPGAGGRLGRLAFAGDSASGAGYGARYPEDDWYGGFAPRLGAVYRLNDKTVLRSGWGLFYQKAFYPGWGGGVDQSGFNSNVPFTSGQGGLEPAFYLQDGFPQNFQQPPVLESDFRNGQGVNYRPVDANKRPYAHQWNITVDRELGQNFSVSIGYVGSAGRRLPSSIEPINALDPTYLSMGSHLYDEFKPGMTSLDGVPLPYAGWVEQMKGCKPSVAQALRPYPQYCDDLQGENENVGESLYNALQIKAERRFSQGIFALVSYTFSKTTSSGADNVQREALTWDGVQGVISPFEKSRNKTVALDDTPHVFSAAVVYELPWGRDRKWLNSGGVANAILGGWQASTVFRYSSGLPFFFRVKGTSCNVPGAFRAACIPAVVDPGRVFAQDKGSFDPGKGSLFNKDAFEPLSAFNFYWGKGNRIEQDIRGFAYHNQDLSFIKNNALPGRTNLQLSVAIFNLWNWHTFSAPGEANNGVSAFNTDLASPDFGKWNGHVTDPRNIQVAVRFQF